MDQGYGCECSRHMIYGMLSIGWPMSYLKLNPSRQIAAMPDLSLVADAKGRCAAPESP
jgi:hypothetical protein